MKQANSKQQPKTPAPVAKPPAKEGDKTADPNVATHSDKEPEPPVPVRTRTALMETTATQVLALHDDLTKPEAAAQVIVDFLDTVGAKDSKSRGAALQQTKFLIGRLRGALNAVYENLR